MISFIIVFYNYFIWLFTGSVPMENIIQDPAPIIIFFFILIEYLIEIVLIDLIFDLLVHIRFRKKDTPRTNPQRRI